MGNRHQAGRGAKALWDAERAGYQDGSNGLDLDPFTGVTKAGKGRTKSASLPRACPPAALMPRAVVSWNVNGLRALLRNQPDMLQKYAEAEGADIVCIGETKVDEDWARSVRLRGRVPCAPHSRRPAPVRKARPCCPATSPTSHARVRRRATPASPCSRACRH